MNSETNKSKEKTAPVIAELMKNRVVIWDHQQGSKIYNSGFFGKPIGIRKPKGQEFERPLELSLIEACYLLEKKKIIVKMNDAKESISLNNLMKIGQKTIKLFDEKILVYKDIRAS